MSRFDDAVKELERKTNVFLSRERALRERLSKEEVGTDKYKRINSKRRNVTNQRQRFQRRLADAKRNQARVNRGQDPVDNRGELRKIQGQNNRDLAKTQARKEIVEKKRIQKVERKSQSVAQKELSTRTDAKDFNDLRFAGSTRQEVQKIKSSKNLKNSNTPPSKTGFEQRVDNAKRTERAIFDNRYTQATTKIANKVTFGSGQEYEKRSFIGKYSQNIVKGVLDAPVVVIGAPVVVGAKASAAVEGFIKSPKNTARETLVDAPVKTVRTSLNPTTPEGLTTYTFAGVGGLVKASSVSGSKGLPKTNRVKGDISVKSVDIQNVKTTGTFDVRQNIPSGSAKPKAQPDSIITFQETKSGIFNRARGRVVDSEVKTFSDGSFVKTVKDGKDTFKITQEQGAKKATVQRFNEVKEYKPAKIRAIPDNELNVFTKEVVDTKPQVRQIDTSTIQQAKSSSGVVRIEGNVGRQKISGSLARDTITKKTSVAQPSKSIVFDTYTADGKIVGSSVKNFDIVKTKLKLGKESVNNENVVTRLIDVKNNKITQQSIEKGPVFTEVNQATTVSGRLRVSNPNKPAPIGKKGQSRIAPESRLRPEAVIKSIEDVKFKPFTPRVKAPTLRNTFTPKPIVAPSATFGNLKNTGRLANISPESKLKPKDAISTITPIKQDTPIKPDVNNKIKPDQKITPTFDVSPVTSPTNILNQEVTKSTPPPNINSFNFKFTSRPPPIKIPIVPSGINIPNFGGLFGSSKSTRPNPRFTNSYTPTAYSASLGITGRKKNKRDKTGLGLRPIIKGA